MHRSCADNIQKLPVEAGGSIVLGEGRDDHFVKFETFGMRIEVMMMSFLLETGSRNTLE